MLKIDSTSLFHMIESSATSPYAKLLCVYSCMEAWLNSPGMRENIADAVTPDRALADWCPELAPYLLALASQAKIGAPARYVKQTLILLQGAIAEDLRNPGSGAFLKARDATQSIMHAYKLQPSRAGVLSVQSVIFPAGILCLMLSLTPAPALLPVTQQEPLAPILIEPEHHPTMSPGLMGRTIALKEKLDAGSCPAPQLINMPPDRVNGYINVINANFSDRSKFESEKLNAFLNWYDNYMARECKVENNQKIVLGMTQ